MKKKPPLLTEHANLIPDHPVLWKLTWLERGNLMSIQIQAQTAFEAWRTTQQVHRTPFHLVDFEQCR